MKIREISGKEIILATPDLADSLTEIAFAAKRHWGYPERWIEIWSPILTVSEDFIEEHHTFVAYEDGKPCGFYAVSLDQQKASLEYLWVLPGFMGQGIGSKLFHHAVARCKELGVLVLEIESDPNAQGFYEHMGARKVGENIREVDGLRRVLPVLEIQISQ